MRVGGTVKNTLKGGGTEKRGGETKISKRRGKLGQGMGTLKRGGWNPLTNYMAVYLYENPSGYITEKIHAIHQNNNWTSQTLREW